MNKTIRKSPHTACLSCARHVGQQIMVGIGQVNACLVDLEL